MNNILKESTHIIEESYIKYRSSVYNYINYRIANEENSKDLTQEVFLRLMDYKQIICQATIKSFIFTISRNLVMDYLRRQYKKQEIYSYIYEHSDYTTGAADSKIIAKNLEEIEKRKIALLPPKRRVIYQMNRFDNKSIKDISIELNLSQRTVENHLFISRKEVREYISKCI